VRFEVLAATPKGQHYIELHDSNGYEIVQIVVNHPDMYLRSFRVLGEWQPYMEAFVNGRGDSVIISEGRATSANDYLDALLAYASPTLRRVIEEERSFTPLEDTAGMTMNEAWEYLNRDPRFPYQAEQPPKNQPSIIQDGMQSWSFPEFPQYGIAFDPNLWDLTQWNNGVTNSWQLQNKRMPSCVITIPRQVSDPFTRKINSDVRLGAVEYHLQTGGIGKLQQYTLYRPPGGTHLGADVGEISLLVYPENLDRETCKEQSEGVLSTLRVMAEH
jgi:hypothetical protein